MRGLTAAPTPAPSPDDLTARAFAALDRRLSRENGAPVAVGVSGGGDSMALLHLACAWAAARGRRVVVLSVDHRLQRDSAAWSRFAVDAARALGAEGEVLAWTGDKPAAGLSAAAREARHRLLAEAARRRGARVVLLAHTADDVAEGELMRAQGSTLGHLRAWAPSPVWPQGRGIFLLRPLLDIGRAELRAWLTAQGLNWIEDPANDDPAYARSRARAKLNALSLAVIPDFAQRMSGTQQRRPKRCEATPASTVALAGSRTTGRAEARPLSGMTAEEMEPLVASLVEIAGGFALDREVLRNAPEAAAGPFLAAALLSAAGTARPPRGPRLAALLQRLRAEGPVSATLAGARIEADASRVLAARDAGEAARGGLVPLDLHPGAVSVWDGRFEILAGDPGWRVVPAAGRQARLEPGDRKALLALPALFRGAQPLLEPVRDAGGGARPVLASRIARVRTLAGSRLRAACGLIAHEAGIGPALMAPELSASYVETLDGPAEAVGIQRPV